MPNGIFTRVVSTTFLKLAKIPCAVSGRTQADAEESSKAPMNVLNIRLNARGAVRVLFSHCGQGIAAQSVTCSCVRMDAEMSTGALACLALNLRRSLSTKSFARVLSSSPDTPSQ